MSRRISKSPFFYKRIFPVVWFGFLALFFFVAAGAAIAKRDFAAAAPAIVVPLVMAVFGFVLMKFLVFDLVDEVWDEGDSLIIRNGRRTIDVQLTEIINVNYSTATNPPRVTLMLREPSELGSEISFMPPTRAWLPFSAPPIARELILRIDAARNPNPDAR